MRFEEWYYKQELEAVGIYQTSAVRSDAVGPWEF